MPSSILKETSDDQGYESVRQATPGPSVAETSEPLTTDFFSAVTQANANIARAPGLVFTLEDLEHINAYVADGLALPTTNQTVISYIGYQNPGIAGLQPADLVALFQQIHANAQKWGAIDRNLRTLSANLAVVASNITKTGNELMTAINNMPVIKRTLAQVGGTKLEDLPHNQVPRISYSNEDQAQTTQLSQLLADMKNDIVKEKHNTEALITSISGFRTEIANQLEPAIYNKLQLIANSGLPATIASLQQQITDKDGEIANEIRTYKSDMKKVGLSSIGGPLGLLIGGSIFGHKAENARKAKNRLINERTQLQNQLSADQTLLNALHKLKGHFSDLDLRLLDAEQALLHLSTVWQATEASLDKSIQDFSQINDSTKLSQFLRTFKIGLDAWRTVEAQIDALNRMFHIFQATVNFSTSELQTTNCTIQAGVGTMYNQVYQHSWIMHVPATSYLEIRFTRPDSYGDGADLCMTHLTSYDSTHPGLSPINVVINGQIYKQNYSPPSADWVQDVFDISMFVRPGENVIRLELQTQAITNYWIHWLAILLG